MDIEIATHNITVPDMPVGISFSAGIDSTLLLYLIAKQTTQDIHLFTVTVADRKHNTMKYSADVLSYISEKFPRVNIVQHNNVIPSTNNGINRLFELPHQYLYVQKIIGSMFTGLNAIPKKEEIDLGWPPEDSDEYKIRNPYENRSIKFASDWYCPFTMLNKMDIKSIYKENNILDLVGLTNSCYTDYGTEPCKQCFACKEKYWAFGLY